MDINEMVERAYNRAIKLAPGFEPEMPKIAEVHRMPWPMAYESNMHAILVRSDTPADYTETALFGMIAHEIGELFYNRFHDDAGFQERFPSATGDREKFADEFGARIAGVDAMMASVLEFDKNSHMKPENLEAIRAQMRLGPEVSAEDVITHTTERLRKGLGLPPKASELEVWSAYEKKANQLDGADNGYPTPFERVQFLEGLKAAIGQGRELPTDWKREI
jgi:hypothetical protein